MSILHIEVEQCLHSNLSTSDLETAVINELQIINLFSSDTTFEIFTNELVSNHVKRIRIGELSDIDLTDESNGSSKISVNDTTIQLHIYRLEQEGINSELLNLNSDGGNETVSAAKHCMLPSVHFDGVWENLIFDERIKEQLIMYTMSAVLFSKRQVDQNIININKVLLLHGPPGTGKTSLCKGLAQKLSIRFSDLYKYTEFIEINSHSLFSKYYSESGKLVMNMFARIKEHLDYGQSLVFVLIDEIESLTHARDICMSSSEPSDSVRVVNAILTQLDNIRSYSNVIILTTSNLKKAVDSAFIDRVDMQIYVGPPGRRSIYNIYLSCIQELLRVGLIQNKKSVNLLPINLVTADEVPKDDNYACSMALNELAGESSGLSGRTLRKIPFLAYSTFMRTDANGNDDLLKFIDAMRMAVQYAKSKSNIEIQM